MKCPNCSQENTESSRFCSQCGNSLTGTRTGKLNPDTVLEDRYVIIKTLGQGGMGAVYLALDTRLKNKPVAIKEMSSNAVEGDLQAAIVSFEQEADLLIHLRHHALPVIHDFFSREENRWYLVMDYIEGHTLKTEAQNRGTIPESEVINWALQLCDILDFLHKRNPPVIFRDLKPDNIMLTPEGQIKLIDFGIARHFQLGNTADTTAYGSSGFAPPEQYGQKQTDARSDIYALGATLHFLLTGRDPANHPFRFEAPSRFVHLSGKLENAIMQALELMPENRPQSITAMKVMLSQNDSLNRQENLHSNASAGLAGMISQPVNEAVTTQLNINDIPSATVPAAGMPNLNQPSINGNQNSLPDHLAANHPNSNQTKGFNWMAIALIFTILLMISGGAFIYFKIFSANTSKEASRNTQIRSDQTASDYDKNDQTKIDQADPLDDNESSMNKDENNAELQHNLAELSQGEQLASQYDTIRVNMIKMLNNLAAGQLTMQEFYAACDSAVAERQALRSQALLLRDDSYKPQLHNELINMLDYSLEYCSICRQGADALNQSDNNAFNQKLQEAQTCSVKIQSSLDNYTANIAQERKNLQASN